MENAFTDENKTWEFDFSKAIWATDRIQKYYENIKGSFLCDVDFIVEDNHTLLFIECKNSNFKGVSKPNAFKPVKVNKIEDVAKKYYDSIHFVNGVGKGNNKRFIYIYVVEARNGNITERKAIRNRLKDRLPFKLQEKFDFVHKLIDKVEVLSLDEWNHQYPQYPAKRLQEKKWSV